MNQVLRINMTDVKATLTDTTFELFRLGGRALIAHVIDSEILPHSHPLGRKNKLIIAPGILAGSSAPNSGRLSIGSKSPLTGGTKESNVGGTAGHKFGRLGIKACIVEGKPTQSALYVVVIRPGKVEILPAPELTGLGNYETVDKLRQAHGEKTSILSIGPAGEMRLTAASVASTDPDGRPSRHAARGGLGAVMGAKGLKAIIIDDRGAKTREPKNKTAFREISKAFTQAIMERKATALLSQYGTVGGLAYISKIGALPTRNYSAGSFEGSSKIGGKAVAEINAARGGSFGHVCMAGCVVRCSNVMHNKQGQFMTAGFEYESAAMLGANLGIDDLDTVITLEKMCDDLGLDTMEMGASIGVAHEAGLYDFGDGSRILDLMREVAQGTVLGRVLGQGAEITARVFGISRVPTVKGQAIPAHDPRREVGTGIGYATNPQGADHTGLIIFHAEDTAEMVATSRQKQIATAAYDSVGLCQMTDPSLEVMAKLVNYFHGWEWSAEDVAEMGATVLQKELTFNNKVGLGPASDRLPDFFEEEALSPNNSRFRVPTAEIKKVLQF